MASATIVAAVAAAEAMAAAAAAAATAAMVHNNVFCVRSPRRYVISTDSAGAFSRLPPPTREYQYLSRLPLDLGPESALLYYFRDII